MVALAILVAAPIADACRARRAPAVSVSGVPKACSDDFVAEVRVAGYPRPKSVSVELDGRVVRRAPGSVRVDCDRLSGGQHELRVTAGNPRRTSVVVEFRAY